MKNKNKKKLKKAKKKLKNYQWVIVLVISVIVAMWIYGMAGHYFPEPLHAGLGQYFDIAAGISIIGLLLSAYIITVILKKRRDDIGTSEYMTIKRKRKKK